MDLLLTGVFFILILGLLIFVHELGHFLAAKITKVPVIEFAIGFGPKLFSKEYKGTKYQLRLFPLGGFVHLEGEETTDNPNGFRNRSFGVKFTILIGGVFMNFITAIIFLAVYLASNNNIFIFPNYSDYNFKFAEKVISEYPIIVSNVDESYGWDNINSTDTIIKVNGNKITSINHFQTLLDKNINKEVNITLLDLETLEEIEKEIKVGGIKNDYYHAEIIALQEGSILKGKLNIGDIIVGFNNSKFSNREEFFAQLDGLQGKNVIINYLSDQGSIKELAVNLPQKNESGAVLKAAINFNDGLNFVAYSDSEKEIYFVKYATALGSSVLAYDLSIYQLEVISSLLSSAFQSGDFKEVSESFGSPVAVGSVVNNVVQYRVFEAFIPLIAFISLSLAIFNILPIPALDGGQILVALIELIIRRRLSDKFIGSINLIGFIFLITLSLLLIFKDLIQFQVFSKSIDYVKEIVGR